MRYATKERKGGVGVEKLVPHIVANRRWSYIVYVVEGRTGCSYFVSGYHRVESQLGSFVSSINHLHRAVVEVRVILA